MKPNSDVSELLTSKELRDKVIERLDVLDKVKQVFLVPNVNMMPSVTLASFYEVSVDVIRKVYQRHKREIDSDGVRLMTAKDICNVTGCHVTSVSKVGCTIEIDDTTILIPNRGVKCYSKRAVLRIGMLLRDSKIAEQVRTQLLNIQENAEEQIPGISLLEIETEEQYDLAALSAIKSHDFNTLLQTMLAREAYMERHMNAIKTQNQILMEDVMSWDNRAMLNRMIRLMASKRGNNFQMMWNSFYKELNYRYGLGLRSRKGDGPVISLIKEDEWGKVFKVAVTMCHNFNIDLRDAFNCVCVNSINELVSSAPDFVNP